MPSSGMLRSVALVRTDVSEERIASIIWAERKSELGTFFSGSSPRWEPVAASVTARPSRKVSLNRVQLRKVSPLECCRGTESRIRILEVVAVYWELVETFLS
jgi:hypothetical protein